MIHPQPKPPTEIAMESIVTIREKGRLCGNGMIFTPVRIEQTNCN